MADDITLNTLAGGGPIVATDDSGTGHLQLMKLALSADGSRVLIPADVTYGLDVDVTRVAGTVTTVERGSVIAHGSASVTTTAAQVLALAATRRSATIQNLGTDYIYLGATGITANNGLRLAPGQTVVIDKSPTAAIFAIAGTGTQTVSYFTESD